MRRRILWWGLTFLVVGLVALAGLTAYQALSARTHLQRVQRDITTLTRQLRLGQHGAANRTVADARMNAHAARDATTGLGWWLARHAPGIGPDVSAIQTLARASDVVSTSVLPETVTVSRTVRADILRPRGGRFDLRPLIAVRPQVVTLSTVLRRQAQQVEAIDVDSLSGPVGAPVQRAQARLSDASSLAETVTRAVTLLPPMLGADGPRTYLLMFQNNAEARSGGGIAGSFAVVSASNGQIAIGKQGDASTIGRFDTPAVPLTREERVVFGAGLGRYPQDVTLTPDFPRTARIISAMWQAREGGSLDGVVSVDPVALARVLQSTGPVAAPGGRRLGAGNAVRVLLSQVYAEVARPQAQDELFRGVARNVIDALAAGRARPQPLLTGLATSATQRRLMVWSKRDREEGLLGSSALGGRYRATRSDAAPQVGVFLNDQGSSKLEYYLRYGVDVSSLDCRAGRQRLKVTLRMRSTVPADATTLPPYVRNHTPGPPGQIRLAVFMYAPVAGRVVGASVDGHQALGQEHAQGGRTILVQRPKLDPGGRSTLTWTLVAGPGQTGTTDLRVTPGASSDGPGRVAPSVC